MNMAATLEGNMLSEALTSLKEVKLRLQRELAQRPEYRALLIINRATAQLAEESELTALLGSKFQESADPEEPLPENYRAEQPIADPDEGPSENAQAEELAPIEIASAMGESFSAVPELPETGAENATASATAPTDKSAKDASRAIDLFLSSTAQAGAPAAAPARPRSFLPFVAPANPVKTFGRN
jgi:hypothetical protein